MTFRTEKASFDVHIDTARELERRLRSRVYGDAAAEAIEQGVDHPQGLVTFTHDQKRQVLTVLDEWLQSGHVDELGDDLMDMRDELRTTDLRSDPVD